MATATSPHTRPGPAARPDLPVDPPAARRNLVIFIVVTLASGWIGVAVDAGLELPSGTESLGALIWLVLPLLTVTVLRFCGTGWRRTGMHPHPLPSAPWYLVALLLFPLITAMVIGTGALLGFVDTSRFDLGALLAIFGSAFVMGVIKNVFEESVWRGFLTSELLRRPIPDALLYVVVGLVWGLWHLPYYLFFLDEATVRQVLDVPPIAFALIATAVMVCWSVAFTELYRLSATIWPLVLMHTVEDATINPIVFEGYAEMSGGASLVFSPIVGLFGAALFVLAGLALRRIRLARERRDARALSDA